MIMGFAHELVSCLDPT